MGEKPHLTMRGGSKNSKQQGTKDNSDGEPEFGKPSEKDREGGGITLMAWGQIQKGSSLGKNRRLEEAPVNGNPHIHKRGRNKEPGKKFRPYLHWVKKKKRTRLQ